MHNSILIAVTLLSIGYLKKGLCYLLGIHRSMKLLSEIRSKKEEKTILEEVNEQGPQIMVLLPLLREQTILKEMLNHFLKISYPNSKIKIFLITTERENKEKEENAYRVKKLYKDLHNGKTLEEIMENHLGLLPGEILKELLTDFKKNNLSLKDVKDFYNDYPTTIELAKKLILELPTDQQGLIEIVHYPYTKGEMAHQLNYCVNYIKEKFVKGNRKNFYISVYNADSKPNLDTFITLGHNALKEKERHGIFPEAFQQISAYCHNYQEYDNSLRGLLLKASSIIQTRWGLGKEIPMLIKQTKFWDKHPDKKLNLLEKIFEPPAYCVGHGMCIRLDTLLDVGLFPTEVLIEDLTLGYYLTLNKIAIRPIPTLENVENPDTISMLIKQKASWFWGMIGYPSCLKYVSQKVKNKDNLRTFLTTIKALKRDALAWLLGSIILLTFSILIVWTFQFNLYIALFASASLFTYIILPSLYLCILLPKVFILSSGEKIRISNTDIILVPVFSYFYLLIASIGPWKTFIKKIKTVIKNEEPQKFKTER